MKPSTIKTYRLLYRALMIEPLDSIKRALCIISPSYVTNELISLMTRHRIAMGIISTYRKNYPYYKRNWYQLAANGEDYAIWKDEHSPEPSELTDTLVDQYLRQRRKSTNESALTKRAKVISMIYRSRRILETDETIMDLITQRMRVEEACED